MLALLVTGLNLHTLKLPDRNLLFDQTMQVVSGKQLLYKKVKDDVIGNAHLVNSIVTMATLPNIYPNMVVRQY